MFVTKIKAFLLNLYPELSRFPVFAQITTTIVPALTPRAKKVMRWGLPISTIFLVLILGIRIGGVLLGFFVPKEISPNPIEVVTPTAAITYQSIFLPLQRSVSDFNPQLPDPLPPVFDEKISLEPLFE